MAHPLIDQLKLRRKVIASFDNKINELLKQNNLAKKIRVPKNPFRLWKYKGKAVNLPINWRYLLSAPFIYSMIMPAIFWHICIEVYHQTCFRLYGIPLVNYRQYFVYDRQLMAWLNPWEKINCIYCSYVNNLIRYSSEIGGRTERYWCPIKYYRRIENSHSQYNKFIATTDPKKIHKQWEELRDFNDLKSFK